LNPSEACLSDQNHEKLIERFTEVAGRYTATVSTVERDAHSLARELKKLTEGAEKIVLAAPDDLEPELFDTFGSADDVITKPGEHDLASAEFGISDAFAAVAETGSVCVAMTNTLGGSVSLFTRKHIAVVDVNTIVSRPRDLLTDENLRDKTLQRNFVFISGPSATADMGPLVRGVHGPGKLHVVILK
jgi:L-lactate dehydrogenase complex protein LldG